MSSNKGKLKLLLSAGLICGPQNYVQPRVYEKYFVKVLQQFATPSTHQNSVATRGTGEAIWQSGNLSLRKQAQNVV